MVDRRELSLGIIFTANIAQVTQALSQLRTQMANFAGVQTAAGTGTRKLAADQRVLAGEFTQVGKQLSRVTGGVQRLLAAFKVIAAYGIAGTLTYGIINSLRVGRQAIFDFDQALYNLQAITNATEGEVAGMGKAIFDVAQATKFSAKEVGDGMILLAQAGFTAAESMDAINAVAMLATGTLSDLKTSSDLLTTVIRAFGLEATDAMKVADVMANAINRSKLTVDKLRIAFNYLGPVADKAGLKIEETAAATMILANSGIRASTIGTGLRQVLARLVAPNEKLREAFISAGVDLTKFTSGAFTMRDVIEELTKIVPDAARAFQLFGLRGAPAVSALTEAGVEGFDRMYESVLRAGEATRMAETQMKGLVVLAKNLRDRLETLAIKIGEGGIAAAFEILIRVGREVVKVLTVIAEKWYVQVIGGTLTLTTALLGLAAAFRFTAFAARSMLAGLLAVQAGSITLIATFMDKVRSLGILKSAFALLALAISGHPIFTLTVVISAIIAGIMIWQRHQKRLIQGWETEERQATKNVAVLDKYKKRLDSLVPGTAEYGAELERLVQEFPQLEKSIDRTTHTLRDHGKAIEDLRNEETRVAIQKLVQQWEAYVKSLERLKRKEKFDIQFGVEFADLPEKVIDFSKDIEKVSGDIEYTVHRVGEVFWNAGYRADIQWSKLVETLRKMAPAVSWKAIEDFAALVLKELQAIEDRINKVKPTFENMLADLPSYWKSTFEELNALEQLHFMESLKNMNARVAAMEKMRDEMMISEKLIAAGRAAIHLEMLQDFVEKQYKETKSAEFTRNRLIELEDQYYAYQKDLTDKEIKNIETTAQKKIFEAGQSGKKIQEIEKITDDVTKKAGEAKEAALARLLGLEAALLWIRKQRAAADKKAWEDEKASVEARRAAMEARMETDAEKGLELDYKRRLADIAKLRDDEIKLAEKTGRDKKEINDRYRGYELSAEKEYNDKLLLLRMKNAEDELKIDELKEKSSLEVQKRLWISSLDTRQDLKRRELELEEKHLRKMLELIRGHLAKASAGGAVAKRLKEEEQKVLYDIEKNAMDQTELSHDIHIKAMDRKSKEYILYRQKLLREAGEMELLVEREKWAIIKEYSDDWLEKLRAGLELAGIDFKMAARDWSTIVQNTANHMAGAMEEYFFQVMKGDLKSAHDAWKGFLDALLREIAKFMADRATAELIGLGLRLVAAFAGGATTPGTAGAGGSTYSSEAGLGRIALQHSGGQIGVDVFPRKQVPQWIIQAAPRLHSGLRPDEFPAILQRGETVTPRDEVGGGDVNITIMTPDTRTMDEWVRRHRSLFAGATAASIKEGDKQLVSSIKRVSRG